jgi:hypothetical protein
MTTRCRPLSTIHEVFNVSKTQKTPKTAPKQPPQDTQVPVLNGSEQKKEAADPDTGLTPQQLANIRVYGRAEG